MADAQTTVDTATTARKFEITAERLLSMSVLAASARARIFPRTRDIASRQFEA